MRINRDLKIIMRSPILPILPLVIGFFLIFMAVAYLFNPIAALISSIIIILLFAVPIILYIMKRKRK